MCFQELLVKGAKKLGKSDIYKNHPNRPTECIGNFSHFIWELVITNFSGVLEDQILSLINPQVLLLMGINGWS